MLPSGGHKSLHLGLGTPGTVGDIGNCENPNGPLPVGENIKFGGIIGHGDFGDGKHPKEGNAAEVSA